MVNIITTNDITKKIAQEFKRARLVADLTQQGLSTRSGVSLGSLKRFERTGKISLRHLIELAFVLRLENRFLDLFVIDKPETLDFLLSKESSSKRQRGRKS